MGELFLVRHGQVALDGPGYDGLSQTGRDQAEAVGGALASRGIEPSKLYVGTMNRHRETVGLAAGVAGWSAPLLTDEQWNEFDHVAILAAAGGLEPGDRSLRADESRRRLFEVALPRWSSGAHDDEYQEAFGRFSERVSASMRQVSRATGSGETTVVVTSAGVISWITTLLLGGDRERWLALIPTWVNGSVTEVGVTNGQARLVSYNDHAHLTEDLVTTR